MRLLDLFCGAGGASAGYARAGFEVFGVDIAPQPNYPFQFQQTDALAYMEILLDTGLINTFDVVHASPPCQAHSDLQKQSKIEYPDLIGPTRALLHEAPHIPYVIENVEGAPLINPVKLCGASPAFPELRVIRHRLFESNVGLRGTPCPRKHPLVFTYDKRKPHFGLLDQDTAYVQVTGGGNCKVRNKRAAMETPWMTGEECNEAIPPAYTRWVGSQLMAYLTDGNSLQG